MPHAAPDRPAVVRFGPFQLDLRSGELSRDGVRTRLQDQPLDLLGCLLEHPGALVTRDELRRRLWPNGTIVDFEHGVNTALKRLRDALGDAAEHPQYIETIPRRGYRLIAPVTVVELMVPVGEGRERPGAAKHGPPPVAVPVGHYRVVEPIGSGAMGEVFRGEDLALKRSVALKFLPAAWGEDPDRLARFQREAELLATLNHPHIAAIYGLAEVEGRRCLVLEMVEGETLAVRIARGPVPLAQALEIAVQIAEALDAAHAHGIVHRDLKPGNVMLAQGGSGRSGATMVKLLDFGIAKLSAPSASDGTTVQLDTVAGMTVGTAGYMSPEQVRGLAVDGRSDLFAFGAVLYEILSGARAFAGDTAADKLSATLAKEPPTFAAIGVDVPGKLERIVRRCVAKGPDDRYDSARDLLIELDGASRGSGPPRPLYDAVARRPAIAGLAAALACLAVALVVWAPWRAPVGHSTDSDRGRINVSPEPNRSGTRIAVALFENRTGDPTLDVVGLMAADWITDGLTQVGPADVALPPSSALGTSAADPGARAAYTDPRHVTDVTGASVVVSGTYALEGEDLVFRARLSEPRSGRVLGAIEPARGRRAHPADVVQAVSQAVVGAVAAHLDASYNPRAGYPPSLEVWREMAQVMRYWYRDWDAVIRHAERAIALSPDYAEARLQLVLARFFIGDYQGARQELELVRGSEARLTEYGRQTLRAYQAHLEGNTWEYLAAAREQMRLAPGMADGGYDAAVMLYALNRPVEAERLLLPLEGRKVVVGWAIPEFRGHVAHLAGRFDHQLSVASEARERYPTMLYFHEHQAAALAALGRTGPVNAIANDALATQASSGTPGLVMLVAAMELRAHGHREEADAMAARAADWYAAQPVDRFLALQTPNRGFEWYRSRPPDIRKRLREEHAMALAWAGRWNEVEAIVSGLAGADPSNVDYIGWRGVLAARRGDAPEALRVSDRLRTLNRPYVFGSDTYWRACIAAQLGQMQQAVDLLNQAFSEGYWFQTHLHRTIDLEPLWDYPPFRELLRPKG